MSGLAVLPEAFDGIGRKGMKIIMPDFKNLLRKIKSKQFKKSDWVVLALMGVLLLVVVMPTGAKKKSSESDPAPETQEDTPVSSETGQAYVENLEKRLEHTLNQMDGVGDVKVMITIEDSGESVVEKDSARSASTVSEDDGAGGVRSVQENSLNGATVYVENGDGQYPYVNKELLPVIKGVVVVAEGGGDTYVKTEITEAVLALFPVEVHRIKVLAMNTKQE